MILQVDTLIACKFVTDADKKDVTSGEIPLDWKDWISYLNPSPYSRRGNSAAAVAKFGMEDELSCFSTGGGALLEYIKDKK